MASPRMPTCLTRLSPLLWTVTGDAVTRACANVQGYWVPSKGDRAALGIEAVNGTSDITATDDKDVNAQVDVSIVALTTDADHRVTSAIADMAEPALTVVSDGGVTAPDLVKTKLELGEDYGMRGASALGKEWYEHSEGSAMPSRARPAPRSPDFPAAMPT